MGLSGTAPPPPAWLEVAGLAGAGKSTLCRALGAAAADTFATGYRIDRKAAGQALLLGLPRLVQLLVRSPERRALLRRARELAYLEAQLADIGSRAPRPAPLGVLDQGPVYLQAALRHRLGAAACGARALAGWLTRAALLSTATLGAVVWLDAPDSVLLGRVRSRARHHQLGLIEGSAVEAFMSSYRAAYDAVLGSMGPRARIVRVDTTDACPEEVLELTLAGLRRSGVLGGGGEGSTGCSPSATAAARSAPATRPRPGAA